MDQREIEVMERLWAIQKCYLERLAPDAASALRPVTEGEYYCRMRYALARRRFSPNAEVFHRDLLHAVGFKHRPWIDRCLWRAAPICPVGISNRFFNLTMSQSAAKEFIARIKRIGA